MIGYTYNSNSIYNQFLNELETTDIVAWPSAEVRFFKFGTKIKEIKKKGFKEAKSQAFYNEPGIYEKTNIDLVINQTDSSRVSFIVTDLFQSEGDINSIVEQIKTRCFLKGIQVAILAIKSDFVGYVYDTGVNNKPFLLNSPAGDETKYRPFYALIFGDPDNIQHLFNNLKINNTYIKEEYFLVLSKYLIQNFNILDVAKTRECRSLNNQSNKDDFSKHFKFILRKDEEAGTFEAKFDLNRNIFTPEINENQLELVGYRKIIPRKDNFKLQDSTLTKDISINSIKQTNKNLLEVKFNMNIKAPKGIYSYMLILKCGALNSLKVPSWIYELSSNSPSIEKDSNKTLNLDKFITALIRSHLILNQPKVAKMYLTVTKL